MRTQALPHLLLQAPRPPRVDGPRTSAPPTTGPEHVEEQERAADRPPPSAPLKWAPPQGFLALSTAAAKVVDPTYRPAPDASPPSHSGRSDAGSFHSVRAAAAYFAASRQ